MERQIKRVTIDTAFLAGIFILFATLIYFHLTHSHHVKYVWHGPIKGCFGTVPKHNTVKTSTIQTNILASRERRGGNE